MADQQTNNQLSEEERMKQMAAQMRAAEYKGLSEEEIQERERQKEMRRKKEYRDTGGDSGDSGKDTGIFLTETGWTVMQTL